MSFLSSLDSSFKQDSLQTNVQETTSTFERLLAKQDYERAFFWAEAFLLREPSDPELFSKMCQGIEILLPHLDQNRREKLIQNTCKELSRFPTLQKEQVRFLKEYGDLYMEKGSSREFLLSSTRCYATAVAVDNSFTEVHHNLSRPFFYMALDGFKAQIQQVAGRGDAEGFELLLKKIELLHQKFSQNPKDYQS